MKINDKIQFRRQNGIWQTARVVCISQNVMQVEWVEWVGMRRALFSKNIGMEEAHRMPAELYQLVNWLHAKFPGKRNLALFTGLALFSYSVVENFFNNCARGRKLFLFMLPVKMNGYLRKINKLFSVCALSIIASIGHVRLLFHEIWSTSFFLHSI
jgi:hypothetical protein